MPARGIRFSMLNLYVYSLVALAGVLTNKNLGQHGIIGGIDMDKCSGICLAP